MLPNQTEFRLTHLTRSLLDLLDTTAEAEFRDVVCAFLDEHGHKGQRAAGDTSDEPMSREDLADWGAALVSRGWVAPAWPTEYGGAGLTIKQQFILNHELAERGLSNVGGLGASYFGPALLVHGSEEQKQELLPGILSGEVMWAQGWSEPGSGSDLASLQTRATRDGDEYVINGQKIWTSGAQHADRMYLLTRTDPDAPKHRGISLLMLGMHQQGVSVRPLTTMDNRQPFNEVFFEDVRVPISDRIGEENRGWYVGMTLTDFERSNIGSNVAVKHTLAEALALAKTAPADQVRGRDTGAWRSAFVDRWVEGEVSFLFAFLNVSIQDAKMVPNYEASMAKLFLSELNQRVSLTNHRLLGLYGMVWDGDREDAQRGTYARAHLGSVSSTVAGGTSEIQRNIIATRGLGLPRG
jgi:alkylation response protein AidB-like acyl-CoA dehydrogenase